MGVLVLIMEIRRADKRDVKEIAKLLQEGLGRDYKPFRFTAGLLREKIAEKENRFFLALDGKEVTGVVRISREDLDLAEIRWLAVKKEFRKRGVARQLAKFALGQLREQKVRKVIVRTQAGNRASVKLFTGLGFRREGYFREHFRKGMDIVQFAKFLK